MAEPVVRDASGADGAPTRGGYRVIVRVRPPSQMEGAQEISVSNPSSTRLRVLRHYQEPLELTFDQVFGPEAEQADIFPVVRDVVAAVVKGRCSTILAYGQTGSGKTHTMTGPGCIEAESAVWLSLLGEQRGIIPRTLEHLFSLTSSSSQAASNTFRWQIHVSFMEIYNERVYDLLSAVQALRSTRHQNNSGRRDGHSSSTADLTGLEIQENGAGGVTVLGITVVQVASLNQVLEVLRLGTSSRTCGDNGVNSTSSRSHAIFQLNLEKLSAVDGLVLQSAKLNLVDLAGSEKMVSPSGKASGVCLQELTAINLSLSTLGKCIAALVDAKRSHVPCRDSKLTRLLQESFRGQSLTAMCICIAPTVSSIEETLSSLKFADRAKRAVLDRRSIVPEPSASSKTQRAQVSQLLAQVNELTNELEMERSERARLEGVMEQQAASRPVSPSRSAPHGRHGLEVDQGRSYYDSGMPCFGDSEDSVDRADLPSTLSRDVWDSDDELGRCSDHHLDSIKASTPLKCASKGLRDFSPADSLGAVSLGSTNDRQAAYCSRKKLQVQEPTLSDSFRGFFPTTVDELACAPSDFSSWSDNAKVDHMANIDSKLKLLTGMVSEQSVELRKRLDTLEVLSVAGLPKFPGDLGTESPRRMLASKMTESAESVVPSPMRLPRHQQMGSEPAAPTGISKLQMLKASLALDDEDEYDSPSEQLFKDNPAPDKISREHETDLERARRVHCQPSKMKEEPCHNSSLDTTSRVPSHPSQPPKIDIAPPKQRPLQSRTLPPHPSQLITTHYESSSSSSAPAEVSHSSRPTPPLQPSKIPQPRTVDSRPKTPPKARPQDDRPRNTPRASLAPPPPPTRRPAAASSARSQKPSAPRPPSSRTSTPGRASTPNQRCGTTTVSSSSSAWAAPPHSRKVANTPSASRESSVASVRSAGVRESKAPSTPRSRVTAEFGGGGQAHRLAGHSPLWNDISDEFDSMPRQASEDEADRDADASVFNNLSAEERRVQDELTAISAEELRIQAELNNISADVEERRAASRDSRIVKGAQAGQSSSQQPSPAPARNGNFLRDFSKDMREKPLRSRSDWTEVTETPKSSAPPSPVRQDLRAVGKCLPAAPTLVSSSKLQDRAERRPAGGASVRSNSSTSVGSTSMSSRPPCAGSDASNNRPGSDCGWSGGKRTAQGSTPVATTQAPSNSNKNLARVSALDIAARCWQEFEGALRS